MVRAQTATSMDRLLRPPMLGNGALVYRMPGVAVPEDRHLLRVSLMRLQDVDSSKTLDGGSETITKWCCCATCM